MNRQRPFLSTVVHPANRNPGESRKYRVGVDPTTWVTVSIFKGSVIVEISSNRTNSTNWHDIERVHVNVDEFNWLTQSNKLTIGTYGRVKTAKTKGGIRIQRSDEGSDKFGKKGKRFQPYDASDRTRKRKESGITLSLASFEALRNAHEEVVRKSEDVKSETQTLLFSPITGDEMDFLRKLTIICAQQIYKGLHVSTCNTCTGYNGDVETCTAMSPDIWRDTCKSALFAVTRDMLSSVCASNATFYPRLTPNDHIIHDSNKDELLQAVITNDVDESAKTFFDTHFNTNNLIVCS